MSCFPIFIDMEIDQHRQTDKQTDRKLNWDAVMFLLKYFKLYIENITLKLREREDNTRERERVYVVNLQ